MTDQVADAPDNASSAQSGEIFCGFCGESQHAVKHMIGGGSSFICNGCVKESAEIFATLDKQAISASVGGKIPTPRQIKAELDQYVIGQEHSKRKLAVAANKHYMRIATAQPEYANDDDAELKKANVLLLGPTGSGKTLQVETLRDIISKKIGGEKLPMVATGATKFSATGYKGEDVESVCTALLAAADGNLELAQRGILFIDEIDKIASRGSDNDLQVNTKQVQQGFLKILEATKISVPAGAAKPGQQAEMVEFDTSNVLIIGAGAFVGLADIVRSRVTKESNNYSGMGFSAKVFSADENKLSDDEALKMVTPDDLQTFGLLPEFVGRFPILGATEQLSQDALLRILTEPRNAPVKQLQKEFRLNKAELVFNDEALRVIAEQASKMGTGARALVGILSNVMEDIMFDLPDMKETTGYDKMTITAIVNGKAQFTYGNIEEPKQEKQAQPKRPQLHLAR